MKEINLLPNKTQEELDILTESYQEDVQDDPCLDTSRVATHLDKDGFIVQDNKTYPSQVYVYKDSYYNAGVVTEKNLGFCSWGCYTRDYRVSYDPKTMEVIEMKAIPFVCEEENKDCLKCSSEVSKITFFCKRNKLLKKEEKEKAEWMEELGYIGLKRAGNAKMDSE